MACELWWELLEALEGVAVRRAGMAERSGGPGGHNTNLGFPHDALLMRPRFEQMFAWSAVAVRVAAAVLFGRARNAATHHGAVIARHRDPLRISERKMQWNSQENIQNSTIFSPSADVA